MRCTTPPETPWDDTEARDRLAEDRAERAIDEDRTPCCDSDYPEPVQ